MQFNKLNSNQVASFVSPVRFELTLIYALYYVSLLNSSLQYRTYIEINTKKKSGKKHTIGFDERRRLLFLSFCSSYSLINLELVIVSNRGLLGGGGGRGRLVQNKKRKTIS